MPRQARKKSKIGIYHVMLRGIDKRNIFLDRADKECFLKHILKAKDNGGFQLFGYCLMSNHVHILIGENEEIGQSIKRITVGYVHWHNNRHGRVGHLFQNRYRSEVVETEKYFLGVLRYIHRNPVEAKIVDKPCKYKWSSYKEYEKAFEGKETFIDTGMLRSYLKTKADFELFTNASNDREYLDYEEKKILTDVELKSMIEKTWGIETLVRLPRPERRKIMQGIYIESGASIRQLSRVLGLSKRIVENEVKR